MERPRCKCGNLCKKGAISKVDGRQLYTTYCRTCSKTRHGKKERVNKILKDNKCTRCGFVPEHSCQLDLDHINGNSKDYTPSNLQTLCANCHRLKTFKNKDWITN